MDQAHPEDRKNRSIETVNQARVAFGFTAVSLTVLVVAALAMWYLSSNLYDEARVVELELPSLALLVMTQFVFVVATGVLVAVRANRYSHRVVEPAHHIAEALQRIRAGDVGFRIQFAERNELSEVATELNLLLDDLGLRELTTPAPKETVAREPSMVGHHEG